MNSLKIDMDRAVSSLSLFLEAMNISVPAETPARFVGFLSEMLSCRNVSNKEIAEEIDKTFDIDFDSGSKNMAIVKDIDAFSLCEHHLALIYDMKVAVGYIPGNKVLGISKVVRCVSMVSKRPQLQEKIATDVIDVMKILLSSNDIAVHIKAKHGCVTARGIGNVGSETVTTNFSGKFSESGEMRSDFLKAVV
jgi:GTP cyclohydrolase I